LEHKLPEAFYDSSVVLFGSGLIGYNWVAKLLNIMARRQVGSLCDCLLPLEILDLHYNRNQIEKGIGITRPLIFLMDQIRDITDQDFERSFELFNKYPHLNPRLHLRIANMLNNNITKLCSTYAAGLDNVVEIERSNFIEIIDD